MKDPVLELERCHSQIHELDFSYDTLISLVPMDIEEYNHRKFPFLLNAKKEGVVI